jgi:hypothetical protein
MNYVILLDRYSQDMWKEKIKKFLSTYNYYCFDFYPAILVNLNYSQKIEIEELFKDSIKIIENK